MKCLACDSILTDLEATRRDGMDAFVDLCYACEPRIDPAIWDNDEFDEDEEVEIDRLWAEDYSGSPAELPED
jgi:hypothetical protein